jgi:CRISPR/Cas system-associated protein Cas10 (large subunit of type III CRISPR-Cas system)
MENSKEYFLKDAQAAISKAMKECLTLYEKDKYDEQPYLLLGGDLSGIQKFIYNIASRKAAKSLKARSIFLQEFITKTVEDFRKEMGISEEHIICCLGGKFYLLLPNTQKVVQTIDNLRCNTDKKLWNEHKGQLSLNIDYVTFAEANSDLWKCLADKLTEKKNQKYKSLLVDDFDKFFEPEKFNKNVKVCAVTGIESEDCVRLDDKDSDSPFVLPSVKKMTTEKGDGKTFEDYADGTYLGILRMDVDNLGKTFIDQQRDFVEYSAFSKWINAFFTDGLKEICETKYKDFVNIIYAGGDDVFAVGRWDKLILFAHDVRTAFEQYIGNENISISGGIVMVGEKFPIAKAAEMAGNAEDAAKNFNNSAKNAFNIFGKTISWKGEYDYVLSWKEKFVLKCKNDNMPRSILHKIMRFAELKRAGDMKYVWHTVYFLKRFTEGKNNAIKAFCEELQTEVLTSPRKYELMAVAARWAELELKEFIG